MSCELYLQITFLIILGISEPPAGVSPVQEPVNQKPSRAMFTEHLLSVVPGYVGSLFSHCLRVKERGENVADSCS